MPSASPMYTIGTILTEAETALSALTSGPSMHQGEPTTGIYPAVFDTASSAVGSMAGRVRDNCSNKSSATTVPSLGGMHHSCNKVGIDKTAKTFLDSEDFLQASTMTPPPRCAVYESAPSCCGNQNVSVTSSFQTVQSTNQANNSEMCFVSSFFDSGSSSGGLSCTPSLYNESANVISTATKRTKTEPFQDGGHLDPQAACRHGGSEQTINCGNYDPFKCLESIAEQSLTGNFTLMFSTAQQSFPRSSVSTVLSSPSSSYHLSSAQSSLSSSQSNTSTPFGSPCSSSFHAKFQPSKLQNNNSCSASIKSESNFLTLEGSHKNNLYAKSYSNDNIFNSARQTPFDGTVCKLEHQSYGSQDNQSSYSNPSPNPRSSYIPTPPSVSSPSPSSCTHSSDSFGCSGDNSFMDMICSINNISGGSHTNSSLLQCKVGTEPQTPIKGASQNSCIETENHIECEDLLSWTYHHPEHWSSSNLLDWLFFLAQTSGLDMGQFRGENFQAVTGRQLCRMSLEEVVALEPKFGRFVYQEFQQMLSGVVFNKPAPPGQFLSSDATNNTQGAAAHRNGSHQMKAKAFATAPPRSTCPSYQHASHTSFPSSAHLNTNTSISTNERLFKQERCALDLGLFEMNESDFLNGAQCQDAYLGDCIGSYNANNQALNSLPSAPISPPKSASCCFPVAAPGPFQHHQHQHQHQQQPVKRKPGRPKIKHLLEGQRRGRDKKAKHQHLWEFIHETLMDPLYNPQFLRWENQREGVFRFVQSEAVAQLWGGRKNNEHMTYEKLSRAMRHYYKRGILERVEGRRLVYKFSVKAMDRVRQKMQNSG